MDSTSIRADLTSEQTAEVEGRLTLKSGVVPRATVRPESLELHFLSPSAIDAVELAMVEQAYDVWHTVWGETLFELDRATVLFSDNFSRQHEIASFFQDGECIALVGHRIVDLSKTMAREDSYFQAWPDAALDAACARGSKVFISNNLTVPSSWRGATGARLKELLLAMSIERFLQSEADCWVGTCHNRRGVNNSCYDLGCTALKKNVLFHNVQADLVAFYREGADRLPGAPETEAILSALIPRSRASQASQSSQASPELASTQRNVSSNSVQRKAS